MSRQVEEFTKDETVVASEPSEEEEKNPSDTPEKVEKETPSEPPAEKEPAETTGVPSDGDAGGSDPSQSDADRAVRGLQKEREKLLLEITALKGKRRELRQEKQLQEPVVVPKEDPLKDVNAGDIEYVERILRAKGYVTKNEAQQMNYEAVKQDSLNAFLEKYPEYKFENDPEDTNWTSLQHELQWYKSPKDPRDIGELLERAHRTIAKTPQNPAANAAKRRTEVAGVGAGGSQRSQPTKRFTIEQRQVYLNGGWTEEEIREMEREI